MASTSPPSMKDFFISYNRHDKHWAEWIAWTLEEAGYSVVIQAWDFRPGGNFVLDMQRASAECQKTIAVLSQTYLTSEYTQSEWGAAFANDPQSLHRKLIPVRVGECRPEGVLRTIVYVDLVGATEQDAARMVLDALKERAKPAQKPGFPGQRSERVVPQHISFPGNDFNQAYSEDGHFEDISASYTDISEQALSESPLAKLVEQAEAFLREGHDLHSDLCRKLDRFLEGFGEYRTFIIWGLVALVIGLPTMAVSFAVNKGKCEDKVRQFDLQATNTKEPANAFRRGQLQYECRQYLGPEPYMASFREASSNAKSDPKIWQLFVTEAIKVREAVQIHKEHNNSDDSELEYSAFLLEQATNIQVDNSKTWLELGKTYQTSFQSKLARSGLTTSVDFDYTSEIIDKSIEAYGLAIEKYDGKPNQSENRTEVLVPKGYALILKGDFIQNNLLDNTNYSEEELKAKRQEKSNLVYREAFNFFELIDKAQPGESSILMGKAIALQRLGLVKESCTAYKQAMHLPNHLKNFGSFVSPLLTEVKCSAEN